MEKSFTAKQLSYAFEVPIAKWKRWAREFIGIDPVAGRFGGVSREFNEEQAFHIYLGGTLVSQLFFSIPEARVILSRLTPWLKERGIWPGTEPKKTGTGWDIVQICRVCILHERMGGFDFQLQGEIRRRAIKYQGYSVQDVILMETPIVDQPLGTIIRIEHPNIQRIFEVSYIKFFFELGLEKLEENV